MDIRRVRVTIGVPGTIGRITCASDGTVRVMANANTIAGAAIATEPVTALGVWI